MIESQQREMRCVLLVSVQTAATTNKQLRSSQEPNMLRKTHACTVCLWLTDVMFNISIRSWFPLWLPPARLMFRSDSFLLSCLSSVPLFGFSSLKYIFSAFYLLHHHVYGYVVGLSCFWCRVSDIPSHLQPWRLARWDSACQDPVCLFWSYCSGPSGYVLGFK